MINFSINPIINTPQNNISVYINKVNGDIGEDIKDEVNPSARKYNSRNIEEGKKFFRTRFIESLKEQKLIKKVQDIKANQLHLSFSIDRSELQKKEEERKELKYSSLFNNKTDKAIFSFNIKKYDNAYQELLNIGIIQNESEFAEFILVYPGFDKSIIGEFLSKEKSLNKNFAILKNYMYKINFKNEYFLDSLRFLLKRMNLPKDSGLILGIIDEFTKAYYEDNKTNPNFTSPDDLYLLASTIMALNTMFTRKDIKNMNIIQKKEFIQMNEKCNSVFLERIYDDLQKNPIVMDNDYLELIYKREAVQNTAINLLSNGDNFAKNKNEELSEQQILDNLESMKKGDKFYKYRNDDEPSIRFFQLSSDSQYLFWYNPDTPSIFRTIKKININTIQNVYIGINSSKLFEKFNIDLNYDQQCISIFCNDGTTLALQNDNEATTKKWYYALKYLINHYKINEKSGSSYNLSKEEERKYIESENEMKLNQLWKNEILINWKYYRKYLIESYDSRELNKIRANNSSEKLEVYEDDESENAKEIFDKPKFFEYWRLGLPKFIRKKIWPIIIGNKGGITENLVEYYSKIVEQLDFEKLNKLYNEYYNSSKTNYGRNEIIFSEDILMNQVINDILKIINIKYKNEINNLNMKIENFGSSLFRIIRIFTLYRQDIIYSKEIAYISTIFLLNSENYYQALVNMVNFVLDSPGIKFIQKNEEFISIRISFFKSLLDKYYPRLHKHLNKLDIKPELYFNKWISSFFIKAFPYEILLKLWDNYIIKGEVFLFEIALSALKLQENDCFELSSGKIIQNLNKIPFYTKYSEEEFWKILYKTDLTEDYEYIEETKLGYEKAILLQSYMNDIV